MIIDGSEPMPRTPAATLYLSAAPGKHLADPTSAAHAAHLIREAQLHATRKRSAWPLP